MTTLALSQNFTPQSIAWDAAGALWALLRLLLFAAIVIGALAALFAVIAMIPPHFFAGVGIIAVYAVATKPRKGVRR